MIKKCIASLLILIGSLSPLRAEEISSNSGNNFMVEIEQAYQKGEYNNFLNELDGQFKRAGNAGTLRGIFESAKKALRLKSEKIEKIVEKNNQKLQELEKSRNEQLMSAVAEEPKLEISHRIDTLLAGSLSDEDQTILRELDNLKIRTLQSNDSIDNKMVGYEIEYYIKSLLLDIASHRSKNPSSDLEKKKIVLSLEKFGRMEKAALDAADTYWTQKIQKAKKAFLLQKSQEHNLVALQDLAMGTALPKNSVEEKVKAIMIDYQQQKSLISEQNQTEIAQN